MENSLFWDDPHNGKGKEYEESSPSEGWTEEKNETTTHIFLFPCATMGEKLKKIECEGMGGAKFLYIYFISHYLTLIWLSVD